MERGAGRPVRGAVVARSARARSVAILAVLKSGAAVLPMDPPTRMRIAFMLADAAPTAVPDYRNAWERVANSGAPGDRPGRSRTSPRNRTALPGPCPDDIAYLDLHLGTTGTPKVVITHHNLTHLMPSAPGLVGVQAWTQAHSYGFDFGVEIFAALLHGDRLLVVPEGWPPPGRLPTTCCSPKTSPC